MERTTHFCSFNQYVRLLNRRQCTLLYQYVATNNTRRHTGTEGHRNSYVLKCSHHNSAGRQFPEIKFQKKAEARTVGDAPCHWLHEPESCRSGVIFNLQLQACIMTTSLLQREDRFGTLLGRDDHDVANHTRFVLTNIT